MPGARVALLLSVYPLWGVARGDARMMASPGVRLAAVHLRGRARFSCWCTPLWLTTSPWPMSPQLEHAAAGVVPGGRHLGAHEGSLLLWVLLMSGWTLAVAVFSRRVPADIVARVLAVMGMVCAGFLAFILFTSGPFARTLPAFPVEGVT
ncbi:Cytochrome c heme lyase subunit CcmF [Salmonella enterica subsp. enterica]|uniref:Cytochrome c heme lyase subunit CcmF n=1 Tax=Salmonella enterica I TaxID=59201 RepID=A0A379WQG1_SALET|nr:Cytochrome c heme lyase subunit CcmF [Salmonella enterica subsp. enterica]